MTNEQLSASLARLQQDIYSHREPDGEWLGKLVIALADRVNTLESKLRKIEQRNQYRDTLDREANE